MRRAVLTCAVAISAVFGAAVLAGPDTVKLPQDYQTGFVNYMDVDAWYQGDDLPRPDANFDGCFSCHANRTERDYTFTFWKFVEDAQR